MKYYGIQNEVKAYINRLQSEQGIAVSSTVIKIINDRVESLKRSGDWSRFSLGFNDMDGDAYLTRAGVTNPLGRCEVIWFTRGMKALNLWSNMVCWPLRNYQNAGTASIVYSLGGLGVFNGTAVGTPTWGANGVRFVAASSQEITTNFVRPNTVSMFFVGAQDLITNFAAPFGFLDRGYSFSSEGNVRNLTLRSNGSGGSGAAATAQTTEQNVFLMIGGTGTGTSVATWKNGTNKLTTTLTSTPNQNNNLNFARHQTSGFSWWDGTASMGMVVNFTVTDSVIPQIYNLYKSTLGSNLGLP